MIKNRLRDSDFVKKFDAKRIFFIIFLIMLYFLMLSVFWNQDFFHSDEGDIFLNGYAIAHGRLLYKEISSQHMPVMYYIAAIFHLCGASTIVEYRLCFYALMAVMWGIIYDRYKHDFDRFTLIMFPILYVVFMSYIERGYAILSEQIQGIGMVILFLELLKFEKDRILNINNMVFISIAMFISFGVAFVSVFPIFYIVLTVLALELEKCIKQNSGFVFCVKNILSSYWKLFIIVLAPFTILILYYLITNSLVDFYRWAYLINREVYPKYLGYGDSVVLGLTQGIVNVICSINIFDFNANNVVYFIAIAGGIYCIATLQKERKNVILTLGTVLFFVGCATRELFGYHGLHAISVLCFMDAYALNIVWKQCRDHSVKITFLCLVGMIFSSRYINIAFDAFTRESIDNKSSAHPYTHYIDLLTDENEVVGINTFDLQIIFESRALPCRVNASCAWMWEWGGGEMMEEYRNNPPRCMIYDSELCIWSYPIIEYAADLNNFIGENYTPLSDFGLTTLYVRNDYYQEACQIIKKDYKTISGEDFPMLTTSVMEDSGEMHISFEGGPDCERILFAVWSEENGQDDLNWYEAVPKGDGKWEYDVDLKHHQSLGEYSIHVYASDSYDSNGNFVTGSSVVVNFISG